MPTAVIGLPRSTLSAPVGTAASSNQTQVFADIEHRFNDNWKKAALVWMSTTEATYQATWDTVTRRRWHCALCGLDHRLQYQEPRHPDIVCKRLGFEGLGFQQEVVLGANYSSSPPTTSGHGLIQRGYLQPRPQPPTARQTPIISRCRLEKSW